MNTSTSRALRRVRLARLAIAYGSAERAISSLVSAARVSVLVWALGARNYGIYVAILGVVGAANLLDFGLHYAVVNAVSQADGRDERSTIREILATAFTIYSLITILALLVAVPVIFMLPLDHLLHLRASELREAHWVGAIGFGGLLCAMPFKIIPAGLIGLQEQYQVSVYRTGSALVGLLALIGAALLWPGQLLRIVTASSCSDLLVAFGFAVWIMIRHSDLSLNLRMTRRSRMRSLLTSGVTFFVTNLANLFKRSLGATIIANSVGPEVAPTFHVPLMLFTLGLSFVDLITGSLWPAYGEAFARADWDWIRRAFTGGARLTLAAGLLAAVLGACFGDQVMAIWTSKVASPPQPLLTWLAMWMAAQIIATIAAVLLNGIDHNRLVMWTTIVESIMSFGGSIIAARRYGPTGVAAAMAIAAVFSASMMFGPAIRHATGGRLRPSIPMGVLGCTITAVIIASLLDRGLSNTRVLVHLVVGASVTTLLYSVVTWYIAFDNEDRARLRALLRSRFSTPHTNERT